MKLQEMLDEMASIRSQLSQMQNDDDVTEEKDGDLRDSYVARYEELDARTKPIIAGMEKVRSIANAAEDPANRERTDTKWTGGTGPEIISRNRRDPFENLDAVRSNMVSPAEIRSRAQDAIEQESKHRDMSHDMAETATQRSQMNTGVARHILETGSREYQDEFNAYLASPENFGRSQRAVNLTAASGGYLLPYVLDPTIVLTNNSSANPFRRVGNVKQTTSNAWQGVTSAGVTAAWLSETTTAADNSPTVGQIQIYPEKAAAWIVGTYEALADTDFGSQLPKLLADAKDRLESDAFATGAGHGSTVPLGVMAGLTATQRVAPTNGSGSATGTGFPVAADVYAVQAALPPRFRNSNNVGWMSNISYLNKIRSIDTYGGSSFWANFGSDTPEQLLGKPIYEASSLYGGTATGTGTASAGLLFGDWDQFLIVDRVGMSLVYDPLVKGTGATPAGEGGWYAFWRVSSGLATASAFRFSTVG